MFGRQIKKFYCLLFVTLLLTIIIPINASSTGELTTDDDVYIDGDLILTSYTPGTYLLETIWHQSGIYAMRTPLKNNSASAADPSNHWRVGCWSTAIGQIINYHQLQSHGNCLFFCSELKNSLGFPLLIANNLDDTTYYWFNMNTSISTTSPTAEIENVTQLLYDVSTVIQKDYGTGGYVVNAGGRTAEVEEHFEYVSSDTEFVLNPPIADIIGEINNERPCMLYIENWNKTVGHAVALDGYRWMNGKFEVHLNMGWGGTADDWYVYNESINASSYVFNGTIRGLMFIRLAPFIPITPNGPSIAHPGTMVKMNTTSSSHRGLPLYYQWDWGDGTTSRWLGRYGSGAVSEVMHSWRAEGTYDVRVRCMNSKGYRSEWSRPHTIRIFSSIDRYIDMVKARLMQGKTGDPVIDLQLEKAIDHLDNSVDKKYWDDPVQYQPGDKYGHRAFAEHKTAVQILLELSLQRDQPGTVNQLYLDIIDMLVDLDQYIANLALTKITSPNQDGEQVAMTKQAMHQATLAVDAYETGLIWYATGKPAHAIDMFRNCWHHTTKI